MTRLLLTGARVFTGEAMLDGAAVLVESGCVAAVLPSGGAPTDVVPTPLPPDALLAPGFIDTQVNGGGGVLFNDTPTADACLAIAAAHRRFGTTAILPTFITDAPETMALAVEAAAQAARVPGGGIVGIHLEGPFLAPARKGVHAERFIRTPTEDDIAMLCALPARFPGGRVLVSLAPEVVPAEAVARLVAAGVVVAGAHSAADYDVAMAAVTAGLTGFTHLFNAMPPIQNRAPGIAGAALDSPAWCGIIADGIHVHPALLRAAIAAKTPDRIMLVTDAMAPTGTDAATFTLNGRTIHRRNGRLETEDGTLAGADLDMATAVRNAVRLLGVGLEDALRMAGLNPARFLGMGSERGRIAPGAAADMVLLGPSLEILRTWVAGVEA